MVYDVLIIGGGPAGYTAALYCARTGLSTLVFEKMSAGGQMNLTTEIDNYPGYPEGIDGFTLGQKMREGAERFGAETLPAEVTEVSLSGGIKTVRAGGKVYEGRTVVIAAGANPRKLGLPGEEELTGRGVHYCAACDGMFYRGKRVAVVGGGNSAAHDASILSRICREVTLIHRRDTLRASKVYHAPLQAAENLTFSWNSTVVGLLSEEGRFKGVRLRDVKTGEERELPCDGLFVSIGRSPATGLFKGQLELDAAGYIVADESTRTSLPGVFAAGDIRTKALRQVVTAVSDGAAASLYIEEYLAEQKG